MTNDMPWWVRMALAGSIMFLLAACLTLSYINGDDTNRSIIVGAIIGMSSTIIGWYFGSSDSSRKKDAVIASRLEPPVSPTLLDKVSGP